MKRLTKKTTHTLPQDSLPKITSNQQQIIKHIYKFRFINTYQFQKLFNHKDPSTTQEWLKELTDLKYIATDYDRKDIEQNRKPAKYFLAPLGRKFLKKIDGYDISVLEKVYKEKGRKPIFKNHCEEIVEMFLFLLSQKNPNEELKFFTQSNLTKFEYFPETELDAYVVFQEGNKIRRFFLHIFKDTDPKWLPRQRIKEYLTYFNDNTWQENTNNSPFPAILFVLPTDSLKFHIFKYGQAVLQKAITADIQLFLETKNAIKIKDPKKLWQKVE
jgi:hypothetical protein